MAEEDVIRYSKTTEKKDDLSVKITLGECGTSHNLEIVVSCLELNLAWANLNLSNVFSKTWLCY